METDKRERAHSPPTRIAANRQKQLWGANNNNKKRRRDRCSWWKWMELAAAIVGWGIVEWFDWIDGENEHTLIVLQILATIHLDKPASSIQRGKRFTLTPWRMWKREHINDEIEMMMKLRWLRWELSPFLQLPFTLTIINGKHSPHYYYYHAHIPPTCLNYCGNLESSCFLCECVCWHESNHKHKYCPHYCHELLFYW